MPPHFRPEHLGRAPARFEESQLVHWQKESLQRMSAEDVGAWLGLEGASDFAELVRHNVVLPADAAPWIDVVRGELPPTGPEERSIVAAAGPEFFAAAAQALDESNADFSALVKILKERTGRKGAQLFMPLRVALTGKTHGPELAPLLKIMPRETARQRLQTHARHP
jgi:glutamyl-tRNA synthetase